MRPVRFIMKSTGLILQVVQQQALLVAHILNLQGLADQNCGNTQNQCKCSHL
ncbi:hypothetical protein SAMN05216383_11242 [Prevotella sp. KH2C16]|nr:hypothetical protein SAMN05216383_11242 [Prevotella sp. KH2C16]